MRVFLTGIGGASWPLLLTVLFGFGCPLVAAPPSQSLSVRFVDSATGYAVRPEKVQVRSGGPELPAQAWNGLVQSSGRLSLNLNVGAHRIEIGSSKHHPMAGSFELDEHNPYQLRFLLDPIEEPAEFQPAYLEALQDPDGTLFVGFVVDDESGEPLADVKVSSWPSGVESFSDGRGYFQILVPLPPEAEPEPVSALLFSKPGHQTEQRVKLELWSNGSWIYRIRMARGKGTTVVDESQVRRRSGTVASRPVAPTSMSAGETTFSALGTTDIQPLDGPITQATAPSNSTVRVPRNIRVLTTPTNIDHVSLTFYTRSVLPSEWIPSWGNIAGGTNSLNAGAVAARCYAIARINSPLGTNYDICATTSCQVYNPANIHALTDTAVNFTANWVLINAGGSIVSTEYSSENNSINLACGDGFTAPSGGCLYDPVCSGQVRFGHGRGMCQWGSAKWATGRKFTGNSTGNSTLNGYARRDWQWIIQHYYPTLSLVKGAPLIIGDDIRALSTVNVRACPGGSITNGINCPTLASKAAGATGVIIGGPLQVTNDNGGYTWYQIQWNDASSTTGWSVENYIERVFSLPTAPNALAATAVATNQINLNWSDTSGGTATAFKIERAISVAGPWLQISNVPAATITYQDRNLFPASTWFYRVRAYNPGGHSGYSGVANATTSNSPPIAVALPGQQVVEGNTLTFTNSISVPDLVKLITDFEPFMSETANGVVLFRDPRNSASTSALLDVFPNVAAVTDAFPTNANPSGRVLRVQCNFTNATNPWLRLTTAGTATLPNPVIDLTKKLRLSVYADKAIQLAVGCRETTTAAGTPLGADGGTAGASIEWAGVTNVSGAAPMPTRTIAASNWTIVTFNFPSEPIRSFSGGNNALSTASGLGVLEHLAIVPAAGTGIYNVYIDNVAVLTPKALNYSLAGGAPTNSTLHPTTGIFTWTPAEWQGPTNTTVAAVITDSSGAPLSVTNLVMISVLESNRAPVLAAVSNRSVYAGATLVVTNLATDEDLPVNTLTFSLGTNAPPGAVVDPVSGLVNWVTSEADVGTNLVTIQVADNGTPPLNDVESFAVVVLPRPMLALSGIANNEVTLSWSAIVGTVYRVQYKNDLNETNWIEVAPDVTADAAVESLVFSLDSPQRFYRVMVVE